MSESASPVCFHCGLPTECGEEGPRLNRLPNGRTCPACADRLLMSLPSLVRDVAQELGAVEEFERGGPAGGGFLPDQPA